MRDGPGIDVDEDGNSEDRRQDPGMGAARMAVRTHRYELPGRGGRRTGLEAGGVAPPWRVQAYRPERPARPQLMRGGLETIGHPLPFRGYCSRAG